jgi:hypothetical protein
MTDIITLIVIASVFMMVPKIISGAKEAIKFCGRVLGWGVGIFVVYFIIRYVIW